MVLFGLYSRGWDNEYYEKVWECFDVFMERTGLEIWLWGCGMASSIFARET